MRSARRRASRAVDRSCLDLGLSLRLLLGLPFGRTAGALGFARLRLTLLLQLWRLPAHQFVQTPAVHARVEHFQGSAARVDLILVSEIGEPFEDPEQLLVPRAAPDLHIAGT